MRTMSDVRAWLSQDAVGTCETAAAPWWRLLQRYRPGARVVVVRRPVAEVVKSLMGINFYGPTPFDRAALTERMTRADAKLGQIERRVSGALSVDFAALNDESTCARVFEYCLPYAHDTVHWRSLAGVNVQISMPGMARYVLAHISQIEALASQATQAVLSGFALGGHHPLEGVEIAQEPLSMLIRDGEAIFAEHSLAVGERADSFRDKNIPLMREVEATGRLMITTARSNGRVFGYLMTVLSPTFESKTRTVGVHTLFFASASFPGLGMRLQRAAAAALQRIGVNEVVGRAGVRGDGDRSDVLYRRMGAAEDGRLYRLRLGDA